MIEQIVDLNRVDDVVGLFGNMDEHICLIETHYEVTILNRDTSMKITGEPLAVMHATRALDGMIQSLNQGEGLDTQKIHYIIGLVDEDREKKLENLGNDSICLTHRGRPVREKTLGQKKYIETIKDNTIIFGVGPAGTGKTYLAVAMAVRAFRAHDVERIVLTRPAVEAGEKLGFLPGDLQEKVDPYLRPLYDALFDMLGAENVQRYLERGDIEVAPLAYMRGRTLEDAFIILDEAQNTTPEQMKMFLTRLGLHSKAVVTGDLTQTDLLEHKKSGLSEAVKILNDIEDIGIVELTPQDVVRHILVQKIIAAYDTYYDEGEK